MFSRIEAQFLLCSGPSGIFGSNREQKKWLKPVLERVVALYINSYDKAP